MAKRSKRQFYLIVCEGLSEERYVQELAVFARENGWGVTFQAKPSNGGGEFSALKEACKKTDHNQTKVMADWDRFERNEGKCRDHYESMRKRLPEFLFQHFNFEDFLLMHFPVEFVEGWRRFAADHFTAPLTTADYVPMLRAFAETHRETLEFFLNYEKGTVFPLTQERLNNLLRNNTQGGLPRSGFAVFLQKLIHALPRG